MHELYKEGVHHIIPSCLASALNSFLGYYIITKRRLFSTGRSVSLIRVYVNNGRNQVGLPFEKTV